MIRKIAFIMLFLVLFVIAYLGYAIYGDIQEQKALRQRIALLPEMSLPNIEGELLHTAPGPLPEPSASLKEKALIINYFSSSCEFCRAEIRSIREHARLSRNARIWLVSDEPLTALQSFARDFGLDTLKSIQVLYDQHKKLRKIFGVRAVPSTFVYGTNDSLLQHFKGEIKADRLNRVIRPSAI